MNTQTKKNRIITIVLSLLIILLASYLVKFDFLTPAENNVVLTDTTIANAYFALAEEYLNQAKFDSCIFYYQKAGTEYDKSKYFKKAASSFYYIAEVYNHSIGNDTIALYHYNMVINYCIDRIEKDHIIIAQCYYRIADIYQHYENNIIIITQRDSLIKHYSKKSLLILENCATSDKYESANRNYYLGHNYSLINQPKEAYKYFEKALKQYLNLYGKNNKQVAYSLKNIAWTLHNMNKPDEALEFANKSLKHISDIQNKSHPEKAYIYYLLSDIYLIKNNYQQAIFYAQEACSIFQENSMDIKVAMSYESLGKSYYYQQNFQKSTKYYKKALLIYENHNLIVSVSDCYCRLGLNQLSNGNFAATRTYFIKSLNILEKIYKDNSIEFLSLYYSLFSYYADIGDYKNELKYALKFLKLPLNHNNSDHSFRKLVTLLILNNIYALKGDYENANTYLLEAESIIKNVYQNNLGVDLNYMYYTYKGYYLFKTGNINKAINLFEKALNLKDHLQADFYGNVISHLIQVYNNKGDFQKSLEIINQFYKYPKLSLITPGIYIRVNNIYTKALIALGKLNNAEQLLLQGLSEYKSFFGERSSLKAQYFLELGKILKTKRQYKEALYYFQKSIQSVVDNFDSDNFEINPSLKDVLFEIDLLNALEQKSKTLADYYFNVSGDIKDLILSFNTYELIIELITNIKTGYKSESSKFQFVELNLNIYQDAIKIAVKVYELTKNAKYKERAFYFSEKSKANVLQEMLTETKAKEFAGIPDSLLEKEKYLKQECGFYDYQVYEETNKGSKADTAKLNLWQNELLQLKKQYDALTNMFEKNYPDYYNLKTQSNIISCRGIQNKLPNDSTLVIEYFLGEQYLYIFSVTKDSVNLIQIHHDSVIFKQIESFRTALIERDKTIYNQLAHELYKGLIKPVECNQAIKKLIIVPDGILGYIPFEVLLTEKIDNNTDFKNYPYLIKDYQVSYSYSSTLLFEDNKIKNINRETDFVGFAPVTFK